MAIKVNAFFDFPLLLLFLLPFASSHNITQILSNFSDFSSFNDLLSRTDVASQINSRATITVLAVDNGAASAVSSRPPNELRDILSLHVVLDYYDADKLQKLANHTAILTTLFQTTGLAAGNNGFLNVTNTGNGQVAFGSAAPGSVLVSNFVKVVVTQPYNISVLQVSSLVVPPGIDGAANNVSGNSSAAGAPAHNPPTSGAPAATPPTSGAPAHTPPTSGAPAHTPPASRAPAHTPPAGSPTSENAPSPASDGPSSEAGAAPSPDSPDSSPAPAADGPAGDSPAEGPGGAGDEAADGDGKHSAAEKTVAGLAGVAAAMLFAVLGSL